MMLLDASYNPIVTNQGREYTITSNGETLAAMTATEENFIKNAALTSKNEIKIFRHMIEVIDTRQNIDKTKIIALFPMYYKKTGTSVHALYGSSGLTASGDYTETASGISGAATYYFDTKINASSNIIDFNNFAFGLVVVDNTNTGTDIGITDGTNFVELQTRASDLTTVNIGTATDSFATTDSKGHWVVNVSSGNFQTYKDRIAVGTETAVTGSAPNGLIYLAALNDGPGSNFSDKTYGFAYFYNDALSEAAHADFDYIARTYATLTNRYYG